MVKKFTLTSTRIVTRDAIISGHIVVSGGKIDSVAAGPGPGSMDNIDVGDSLVVPGFVDLHIHGTGGWGVDDEESVLNMARILADNGTTAFYPTPATSALEVFLPSLAAAKSAVAKQEVMRAQQQQSGAEILGLHLEGPFLNVERKGAMPEKYLLEPNLEKLNLFEQSAQGLIQRVTVAPELPGGLELIAELKERGYIVAGGHSTANAKQARAGIDAGITVANHLYNAMTGLHHREPGCVGTYLTDDRVICEIIADGIHVHPLAIEVALRCKGPDNIFLISDAISASGLPAGHYEFLGRSIHINERGVSRNDDGTIAGSTCLMPVGFETIAQQLGYGPIFAARLAATNPARVAGVAHRKGTLEAGKDADITVLDEHYQVSHCCVHGVWHKTPEKSALHLVRKDIHA